MSVTIPKQKVVQEFFCEAMSDVMMNYDSSKQVPGYPEMRYLEYKKGNLLLIHQWLEVVTSPWTRFVTSIYVLDKGLKIILWTMIGQGIYDPRALDIVKHSLKNAYEEGEFRGGRGRSLTKLDSLTYHNIGNSLDSFMNFVGSEFVTDERGRLGGLEYQGLWLFNIRNR